MKVKQIDFNGITTIGLYAYTNNKITLLGYDVSSKYDEDIKKTLNTDIKRVSIAGTSLLGVFIAGYENKIIVPDMLFEKEEEKLKELKIDYLKIPTIHTCLGNNILIGEKTILANPEMEEKALKLISDFFNKPVQKTEIVETQTIASLFAVNRDQKKALLTNDLNEEEAKEIGELIGYEVTTGSVSRGSPHIKSAIINNKNGILISTNTGGPELVNTTNALYDE